MDESRTYEFKPVNQLVFSDDFMFGAVMREPDICKGVLELLLQVKIDHIEYPELQKSISPFYSKKGVRLDVYVAGCDKVFDVECQTYKIESIGKRTRYYQAMIDADSLLKGAAYSELKESYIIFICLDDPFDKGLPAYTFERKCREDGSVDLGDKTHHVVFNAEAYKEEKDPGIRAFLSFVRNNTAESDLTRRIANMVQAKRFEQTFVNEYLAWNLHDYDVRQRGIKEGREDGIKEGKFSAYAELVKDGLLSVKDAAEKLGMSEADFQSRL
ncbi:MAG: Rpn family recombination-promoting nuclease/putative transposase [Treponema sp.]|nr:Rpn family recombination-promoting nuclease/putative transposase [Treponema sp.]MBQ7167239.1 Rpn family recombination-promoting nuclease/putative transposase [Treponema sp.]